MATTPTTTTPPAGLTKKEADALRADLLDRPAGAITPRSLTPRERLVASLLPDRAHLDGCPSIGSDRAGVEAEAYEQVATAPEPSLARQGITPNSVVIVVRCIRCSGVRYYPSPSTWPTVPVGEGRHVSAFLASQLDQAEALAASDLDGTL